MKLKRKINSGLKAWNDARSFFSKQNKLAGKKYNGVELNSLTKSFLFEHYGKSFDSDDLKNFIKVEVPNFFNNPLEVSLSQLTPTIYYMMDFKIQELGVGMDISIKAGDFGDLEFNTSNYDYSNGLQQIVENVRIKLNPTGKTKSPNNNNGLFDGVIKKKPKTKKDSKNPKDYFIEWILFIDDEYVSEIRGTIPPKKEADKNKIFKIRVKKPKKGDKKGVETKTPTKIAAPEEIAPKKEFTAKEIIDIEKAKKATIQAEQKKLDSILKLINAGYTKAEINKLLGIK
jgi:hypothetical protein